MKIVLALSLSLLVLVSTGCRTRYDVTLTSGNQITNVTRPVLDESGVYQFKDVGGNTHAVPAMRVRAIQAR